MRPSSDSGPLDSLGQRNELLRVRFGQIANRLDDIRSLTDDFAELVEPFEQIFVELPQARTRILETEALLSREIESGQLARREVDTLSSRLSAATAELRNERARALKLDSEVAELAGSHEEARLLLREKSSLLENAELQLGFELEKQHSLAGDLAAQRAENQISEKTLTRVEQSLQREGEQRLIFETESRRLQQVVEEQMERAALLNTQNSELTQDRERYLAEVALLRTKLSESDDAHRRYAAEQDNALQLMTAERSGIALRLDSVTGRLSSTDQILAGVRNQLREKDEALRQAERGLKEAAGEKQSLDRRNDAARNELLHYKAQLEAAQRSTHELIDRSDMLQKALAAKDAALENALSRAASLTDHVDGLTRRHESDRLTQEASQRRLVEELESERAERALAQGALEIARENRSSLQRQNETLKKAVRVGRGGSDESEAAVERAASNVSFLQQPTK